MRTIDGQTQGLKARQIQRLEATFRRKVKDDVLVTPGGAEVLTDGAPKDPDEVEALVGSGGGTP